MLCHLNCRESKQRIRLRINKTKSVGTRLCHTRGVGTRHTRSDSKHTTTPIQNQSYIYRAFAYVCYFEFGNCGWSETIGQPVRLFFSTPHFFIMSLWFLILSTEKLVVTFGYRDESLKFVNIYSSHIFIKDDSWICPSFHRIFSYFLNSFRSQRLSL